MHQAAQQTKFSFSYIIQQKVKTNKGKWSGKIIHHKSQTWFLIRTQKPAKELDNLHSNFLQGYVSKTLLNLDEPKSTSAKKNLDSFE